LSEGTTEKYRVFHQKGRWNGLPLRVEDTGDAPRFEPLVFDTDGPDALLYGVPNHGMMAGQPTNVVLVGDVADDARTLALVDTGTVESYDALLAALDGTGIPLARIGQIVLTHTHPDHIGNAAAIQAATGATTYAHPREQRQIERWGGGIEIDVWLGEDERIACDGFELETIFTPGHSPGHYCVVEPVSRLLIAGDMLSGFGSVGVFPPWGSMREYIDSLQRLLSADTAASFSAAVPGHGPVIADARAKIEEYIEHRLQRQEEVFDAVRSGADTVDALLPIVYPDVEPHLSYAARSTLLANLEKLEEDGRVTKLDDNHYAVRIEHAARRDRIDT
jgi:glyoxylase-like metal-dependent hydrolase (beta-lactamase superfamily II)